MRTALGILFLTIPFFLFFWIVSCIMGWTEAMIGFMLAAVVCAILYFGLTYLIDRN
jgi:uncharacterized BrkB/YihY/UPF0761 family membrane protein